MNVDQEYNLSLSKMHTSECSSFSIRANEKRQRRKSLKYAPCKSQAMSRSKKRTNPTPRRHGRKCIYVVEVWRVLLRVFLMAGGPVGLTAPASRFCGVVLPEADSSGLCFLRNQWLNGLLRLRLLSEVMVAVGVPSICVPWRADERVRRAAPVAAPGACGTSERGDADTGD